mmetsp:Transcript_123117/g.342915  ORF Transcript_123117/g.342915 Transcript_123117/m.342915 type:complete len:109 (+) Transcript_123117:300-626(+)
MIRLQGPYLCLTSNSGNHSRCDDVEETVSHKFHRREAARQSWRFTTTSQNLSDKWIPSRHQLCQHLGFLTSRAPGTHFNHDRTTLCHLYFDVTSLHRNAHGFTNTKSI